MAYFNNSTKPLDWWTNANKVPKEPTNITQTQPTSYFNLNTTQEQNNKPSVVGWGQNSGPNSGGLNNSQKAQDNYMFSPGALMSAKKTAEDYYNKMNPGGKFYNIGTNPYIPSNIKTEDIKPEVSTNSFADLFSQMQARENERYQQRKSYVESAFQALLKGLLGGHDSIASALNKNADKAQQEAYVNKMKAEKDLPQQLSALGITGGASESTAASLQNSYGQSRNSTENSRAESIAQSLQQLNTAKFNLEAEKQNKLMNLYDDNINSLNSIAEKAAQQQAQFASNQAQNALKQFEAQNALKQESVKQQEEKIKNNPYYQYVKNSISEGRPIDEIKFQLINSGMEPKMTLDLINSFSIFGG